MSELWITLSSSGSKEVLLGCDPFWLFYSKIMFCHFGVFKSTFLRCELLNLSRRLPLRLCCILYYEVYTCTFTINVLFINYQFSLKYAFHVCNFPTFNNPLTTPTCSALKHMIKVGKTTVIKSRTVSVSEYPCHQNEEVRDIKKYWINGVYLEFD